MTENGAPSPAPVAAGLPADATAGALLKAARTANGIHIAALAAAIKVSVRKLELLEADRFDELPDATFARALAQTVCRYLKVDPAPILAKLPHGATVSQLEHVARGLNQPFRDPTIRRDLPGVSWLGRPAVWLPLLIIVAAVGLWFAPPGLLERPSWLSLGGSDGAEATSPGTTVIQSLPPSQEAASETVHSAPPVSEESASAAMPAASASPVSGTAVPALTSTSVATTPQAAPSGVVVVRARAESWVEVQDAGGRLLISRLMSAGETVGLDGSFPMRVRVGNAQGTDLVLRGEPVDLTPHVRDNVARLQLK